MKNYSLEKNSTLKEDEFKNEISVINNSAVKMVKKIEEELEKRILYEKEIMQKNRLASMGEMIDNIAHQWRQPLMKINAIVLNTDRSIELKKYDEKYLQNRLDDISQAVYHMSNTIDTFREFLNPHKSKESFEISNSINKSLKVLNTLLVDIEVNINQKEIYINAYESEFMQVIISILSNSIDIFKARDIEKKYINIDIYEDDIHYFISIKDSAGGIKEDIIDKIFEPYFTTKHKSGGTGMGLYISKLIIQSSFKGDIKVKAVDNGVKFILEIPKGKEF
jgi:C4-dicarboxylate-specific signal transduction histidine kinase